MPESEVQRNSRQKVLINFILDRSGSMEIVREETIHGFNKYLEEIRKENAVDYLLSLTLFGGPDCIHKHVAAPLEKVDPLSRESYRPQGFTPLYDAIGATIAKVDAEKPQVDKVLTVILTDGHENSSREYNLAHIKALIDGKEKQGNWTFVFLGATPDAWDIGVTIGVPVGNVYQHDPAQTPAVYASLASSTSAYSRSADPNSMRFVDPKRRGSWIRGRKQ